MPQFKPADSPSTPLRVLSPADISALVATAWGEARGASAFDRILVMQTVLRRAQLCSTTPAAEAHRRLQFSCWNAGDPNARGCGEWETAVHAALSVEVGPSAPTHYHTHGVSPLWARGATPCTVTRAHIYYNDIA